MRDGVEDGATLGWKLQEEAAADDNGLCWSYREQEWKGGANIESSCEAVAAGSANILEMLIAAVVDCHRKLRKVTHTQPPRWTPQAMGTWLSCISTFLSILEVSGFKSALVKCPWNEFDLKSHSVLYSLLFSQNVVVWRLAGRRPSYLSSIRQPMVPAPRTRLPRPHCWHCGLLCEERFVLCLIQKALWLWSFLSSAVVFPALTADYQK